MGTFLLACCTGGTEGSRQIVYTPGILPVVPKDWGNAFLRKLYLTHLLQKNGPEMNCFQWDFEWENGLERGHYGPLLTVPSANDGLGKCWWWW